MANPLICIFNPVTTLIDQIPSVSAFSGASAAGSPVVLNLQGVLDPSLLGEGTTATAGELLAAGALVNLYNSGGNLFMQNAFAGAVGTAPSGSAYPVPAVGFVTGNTSINNSALVLFNGVFTYGDPNSEFGASDIGAQVFTSQVTPGGVTKTRPSGGGQLQQVVGNVVGFIAPNFVQVALNIAAPPAFNGFNNLASGTNTTATMVVGTGATLSFSGTGVINANTITGVTVSATPPSAGQVLTATSPTAANWANASTTTAFNGITSGTNVIAAMVVGTGASIAFTGTGSIQATKVQAVVISATPPTTGQVLTATGATAANWQTPSGGGTPASPNTSVQFNNSGSFGGDSNFEWDNTNKLLKIGNGSITPPDEGGFWLPQTSTDGNDYNSIQTEINDNNTVQSGSYTAFNPSINVNPSGTAGDGDYTLIQGNIASHSNSVAAGSLQGIILGLDHTTSGPGVSFMEGANFSLNVQAPGQTVNAMIGAVVSVQARGAGVIVNEAFGYISLIAADNDYNSTIVEGVGYSSTLSTHGGDLQTSKSFESSPTLGRGNYDNHYAFFVDTPTQEAAVVISQIQITSNVVTIHSPMNSFIDNGDHIILYGLTTATFLNGVHLIVSSGGGTNAFSAPFTHANYGLAADTGFASFDGAIINGYGLYVDEQTSLVLSQSANFSPIFCASTPYAPATITATAIATVSGNQVLTVTATNTFKAGDRVTLSGTAESFLNGLTVTVLSTGLSTSQFEAYVNQASYSNGADTGTAQGSDGFGVDAYGSVSIAQAPLPTGAPRAALTITADSTANAIEVYAGTSAFTGVATSIVTKTTNYSVTPNDYTINADATGGTFTITLPTTGLRIGQLFQIKKIDNVNAVTISSSVNIDGTSSLNLVTQYESITVQWDGTQYWIY